ncbi:hypothetical protein [Thermobispora bispora]|uniref:hypothetical protein n=1 Tax=Thermobispora bispora TaxID=2006 RepID=UPI001980AA83|nr:hypothetical protein [Thermobispora bispora]QSI49980.1 hypothetical protein CYL17_18565 [Thermobispora bispora]
MTHSPTEVEALRAEVARLRAELDAQQRAIPALPEEHDGERIEWRPWEPAPTLSHIPGHCFQCAYPGPLMLAFGLVDGVIRYQAVRCPSCQEMSVCKRIRKASGLGESLKRIAYHPPSNRDV